MTGSTIGSAVRGENPTVLARMRSGFAVIGDAQFIPGYCLLLAVPQTNHVSDLPFDRRGDFLLDMSLLGEAVMVACNPRRVNYEILGNTDPYLHAHVWPRYEWEPGEYIGGPVWRYQREQRPAAEYAYDPEKHGERKRRIATALGDLMTARG